MQGILLCNGRKISPLNICFVAWRPREYITYFMLIAWKSTCSRCIYVTEASGMLVTQANITCVWPGTCPVRPKARVLGIISVFPSLTGGEGGCVTSHVTCVVCAVVIIRKAVRTAVPGKGCSAASSCQSSSCFSIHRHSVGDPWHFDADPDQHPWLMDPDPTPDPTALFWEFKDAKKMFPIFFSYNLPTGTLSSVLKIKFFAKLKFVLKVLSNDTGGGVGVVSIDRPSNTLHFRRF